MSKLKNKNTIGVRRVYKKSLPPTNVNSLLFFDEVYFKGELSIGNVYETRDETRVV